MATKLLSQFDALHEQAAKAVGLDDFGTTDYVEPMKLMLADYDDFMRLTPVGQQMASGHAVGLLVARLLAHKGFKEHPDFAAAPIEQPIIITGMPRTGSTGLHRLMAQDPDLQWLPPWLGNTPMPRPPRETWESNPWFQMTAQGLEQFYQAFPKIKAMHPMFPAEADECRYGMEPSFWSPGVVMIGAFGDYARWVADSEPHYAYDYYRKMLGLVAGGDRRRWLLKDPTTHLFAPEAMIKAFPDAYFVYTHRDPVTSIASVSSMIYEVRSVREYDMTRERNGREQVPFWCPAAARMEKVMRSLDPARVIDIHVDEYQADPVGTAERIYRHFGLPVSTEAREQWQAHVGKDARGGHGDHRYQAENWGIDRRKVFDSLGIYGEFYRRRYEKAG